MLLVQIPTGFRVIESKSGRQNSVWAARGRDHIERFTSDSRSLLLAYAHPETPRKTTLTEISISGTVLFKYNPDFSLKLPSVMAVSETSDLFVTADDKGTSYLWRRRNSVPERSFSSDGYGDVVFGPGRDNITLVGGFEIFVRDLATWDIKAEQNPPEYYDFFKGLFTRNDRSLLVLTHSYISRHILYSLDTETLEYKFRYSQPVDHLSVGLNTLAACVVTQKRAFIRRFSMELKRAVKLPYDCSGLALSPDSKQLVTINRDRTRLDAWDTSTGKKLWTVGI